MKTITHLSTAVVLSVCLTSGCTNSNNCEVGQDGLPVMTSPAGGGGSGGTADTGGSGGAPTTCPESECTADDKQVIGKADCDDGDPKTVDRCVAVAPCGGFCVNVPGQCDGLDPIPIQAAQCEDGNECTDGRCSGKNTCVQLPFSGGTCTGGMCVNGECLP